jgi:hypothetical protein
MYAVRMGCISQTCVHALLISGIVTCGIDKASAQQNDNPLFANMHAPWVSCYDLKGERFIGPKAERTPVLVSPNRMYRAYAEIHAENAGGQDCSNKSELFIQTDGSFKSVFSQDASQQNGTANSLGPVAWSPDSRWLLVERGLWFYASDYGAIGLLLYDTRMKRATVPDVDAAIHLIAGNGCELVYRIVGFDARNRVQLQVMQPPPDIGPEDLAELAERHPELVGEAPADTQACMEGTWFFDPVSLKAEAPRP